MSDLPEGSSFREVLKILNIGYTIKKTQEKKTMITLWKTNTTSESHHFLIYIYILTVHGNFQ